MSLAAPIAFSFLFYQILDDAHLCDYGSNMCLPTYNITNIVLTLHPFRYGYTWRPVHGSYQSWRRFVIEGYHRPCCCCNPPCCGGSHCDCLLQVVVLTLTLWRSTMTSSNANIFRVTGPLCGEFTGHQWIPLTKVSDAELWCFLRLNKWLRNNREAGGLRCHRTHYDVTVMKMCAQQTTLWLYMGLHSQFYMSSHLIIIIFM